MNVKVHVWLVYIMAMTGDRVVAICTSEKLAKEQCRKHASNNGRCPNYDYYLDRVELIQ
jgi:hypothetical protein